MWSRAVVSNGSSATPSPAVHPCMAWFPVPVSMPVAHCTLRFWPAGEVGTIFMRTICSVCFIIFHLPSVVRFAGGGRGGRCHLPARRSLGEYVWCVCGDLRLSAFLSLGMILRSSYVCVCLCLVGGKPNAAQLPANSRLPAMNDRWWEADSHWAQGAAYMTVANVKGTIKKRVCVQQKKNVAATKTLPYMHTHKRERARAKPVRGKRSHSLHARRVRMYVSCR